MTNDKSQSMNCGKEPAGTREISNSKIIQFNSHCKANEAGPFTYDWESAQANNKPSGIVEDFCQLYTAEEAVNNFYSDMLIFQHNTEKGEAIFVHCDKNKFPGIFAFSPDKRFCANRVDDEIGYFNAFDAVLFLKYAYLDSEADKHKIKNRLPSFLAWKADLNIDAAFQDYTKRKKLEVMGMNPDRDEWKLELEFDKNGNTKNCLANYIKIFENDNTFAILCYSVFKEAVVKSRPFKWTVSPIVYSAFGEELSDMDEAQIRGMLAEEYGIANPNDKHISTASKIVANRRPINPLKDFYNRVRDIWDGVERIPYLFQVYVGLKDNKYARFLSTALMIGIVARSLATGNGVKVDIVPVLHGRQGLGKSTFCSELMPPGYFQSIDKISGKDIAIELGIGVCELLEAEVLKCSSVAKVKGFLTKTFDNHRFIFEKHTTKIARKCVFMITTNEQANLLKDETGNRRFFPVECSKKYRKGDLTDEIRDQLFAEALTYYDQGDYDKYLYTEDEGIEAYANDLHRKFEANGELKAAIEERIENTGATTLTAKELYIHILKQPEDRYLVDSHNRALLNSILDNLSGWQRDDNRTNTKDYGKQYVYRKVS